MVDAQCAPNSQETNHYCLASINLRLLFYFPYSKQIKCESAGNALKKYQFLKISIYFFLKKSPIPLKITLLHQNSNSM